LTGSERIVDHVLDRNSPQQKPEVITMRLTLIGKDPARINDLWQMLYRGGFYRGGPVLMSAIAGIDQALWDIKGKALGVPVHELLGGRGRGRIKGYSWIGGVWLAGSGRWPPGNGRLPSNAFQPKFAPRAPRRVV
jgi:L-alanine-DL-glutamate epimerase-like enolase superfamily enzyme